MTLAAPPGFLSIAHTLPSFLSWPHLYPTVGLQNCQPKAPHFVGSGSPVWHLQDHQGKAFMEMLGFRKGSHKGPWSWEHGNTNFPPTDLKSWTQIFIGPFCGWIQIPFVHLLIHLLTWQRIPQHLPWAGTVLKSGSLGVEDLSPRAHSKCRSQGRNSMQMQGWRCLWAHRAGSLWLDWGRPKKTPAFTREWWTWSVSDMTSPSAGKLWHKGKEKRISCEGKSVTRHGYHQSNEDQDWNGPWVQTFISQHTRLVASSLPVLRSPFPQTKPSPSGCRHLSFFLSLCPKLCLKVFPQRY